MKEKQLQNAKTLRQIKYEHMHRHRLSTNYIDDSLLTKKMFDLFIPSYENKLGGFLQSIDLSPFGFLAISQIQVKFINSEFILKE